MNGVKRKRGFTICVCVGPERGGGERERQREREKEKETERGRVCVCVVWGWFGANMAGLRNIRNTNAFKFILQVFILSQKHILGVKKVVWCVLDVV